MKNDKPFDMRRPPIFPRWFLMPVEWAGTLFYRLMCGLKVTKHNCEGLKPPCLLLASHASFPDFPLAVTAMFPHRSYWVISIEEFIGREWLFRSIGAIYKRKFTKDLTVVRHLLTAFKRGHAVCTIYPEARYSLAGVNEQLDGALGDLVHKAGCPVAVLISHGHFLYSPQWCKKPTRRVRLSGDLTQIVTREEAQTLPATEIQKRIEDAFVYDDYKWQYDNKIPIRSKYRAHNIHKILYRCPHCGKEFLMRSRYTRLWCESCGSAWEMDEYGRLHCENGEDTFPHVPDWYRWERESVRLEVAEGRYRFCEPARLERIVNCRRGFETLGQVTMTHDENGFTLEGTVNGEPFRFNRSVLSMMSCHIEYNFKGRGGAVDLASLKETYFVFPESSDLVLTKLHFAAEELHKAAVAKRGAALHGNAPSADAHEIPVIL